MLLQKSDGLIFPDRASLYVTAIEDNQYKQEKINCKLDLKKKNAIYDFILSKF